MMDASPIKSTIHWFSVYPQSHVSITTMDSRASHHATKETLDPLVISLHPHLPLIYCLSLRIFPFWVFPVNEITQYVASPDWLLSLSTMFSRFLHVVTVSAPCSFLLAV